MFNFLVYLVLLQVFLQQSTFIYIQNFAFFIFDTQSKSMIFSVLKIGNLCKNFPLTNTRKVNKNVVNFTFNKLT